MVRSWIQLVDSIVPVAASDDRDRVRRTRLAVLLCLVVVASLFVLGTYHLFTPNPHDGFIMLGIGAVWMGALALLRRTQSLALFGHLVCGMWLFAIIGALIDVGSLAGHDLMAISVAALFATFFVSVTAGAIWTAVEVVAILAAGWWVGATADELLNGIITSVFLFALVAAFERTRRMSLDELRESEASRRHAQEELAMARADRMAVLGQLAAGVAHEVNNPLSYVLGNLVFLRDELEGDAEPDEEWSEALTDAIDGATRVKRIVGELKTYSRVDEPQTVLLDVTGVLESALRLADTELSHRCKVIRTFDDVPQVLGDEGRLGQVFVNLLVNAAQAMPEGGGTIDVGVARHGDQVEVTIADDGKGIPPHLLERVFDPFFTTKPVGRGTGLGLSVSRNLVKRLGGDLRIESEVGRGTEVTIALPAAPTFGADRVQTSRPPIAVAARRVLVIDDDPLVLRAVKRQLRGHDVVCASGGEAGLELLTTDDSWDAILCDIMMPGMSGPELYRELCDRNEELAARMTFITGGAVTNESQVFVEDEAHRVLRKPLDPEALQAVLQTTMTGPGSERIAELMPQSSDLGV